MCDERLSLTDREGGSHGDKQEHKQMQQDVTQERHMLKGMSTVTAVWLT